MLGEAAARGVHPSRISFLPKLSREAHMRRYGMSPQRANHASCHQVAVSSVCLFSFLAHERFIVMAVYVAAGQLR